MANKISACQGCKDNTSKSQGGRGRNCNGYTQEQWNRCPEWKIREKLASKLACKKGKERKDGKF